MHQPHLPLLVLLNELNNMNVRLNLHISDALYELESMGKNLQKIAHNMMQLNVKDKKNVFMEKLHGVSLEDLVVLQDLVFHH